MSVRTKSQPCWPPCLGRCNSPVVPALSLEEGRLLAALPWSFKKIWCWMTTLLGRDHNISCATGHTADGFAACFVHKINVVRSDTPGLSPPPILMPVTSSIASFRPCTQVRYRRSLCRRQVLSWQWPATAMSVGLQKGSFHWDGIAMCLVWHADGSQRT